MLFSIGTDTTAKEVVTLRVFCDEYKDLIKSNRSKNYYSSVVIALNHLTDYSGLQKPIRSISYKDVEMFMTDLQKKIPKGFRVYYRTLKAAFNKAVDWNYISVNHFVKVKLPKKNKLNPLFLNEIEVKKIVKQIDSDVVKDVVVFAFNTGMRLNEIVNLKWKNIDFEKKVIIVGDEDFVTKGKNQRYVPFGEEVERILQRIKNGKTTPSLILPLKNGEKNSFVFAKDNGMAYTGDYFSKKFKRACRDAGLDEAIHFHTLRHSFASNLAQQGVSLYVIKELLGHSSISTTEIYAHLDVGALREAVKKLDTRSEIRDMRKETEKSNLKLLKYKG